MLSAVCTDHRNAKQALPSVFLKNLHSPDGERNVISLDKAFLHLGPFLTSSVRKVRQGHAVPPASSAIRLDLVPSGLQVGSIEHLGHQLFIQDWFLLSPPKSHRTWRRQRLHLEKCSALRPAPAITPVPRLLWPLLTSGLDHERLPVLAPEIHHRLLPGSLPAAGSGPPDLGLFFQNPCWIFTIMIFPGFQPRSPRIRTQTFAAQSRHLPWFSIPWVSSSCADSPPNLSLIWRLLAPSWSSPFGLTWGQRHSAIPGCVVCP